MHNELLDFFRKRSVNFEENADISTITSIKCGGPARYLVQPRSVNEIIDLVEYLYRKQIRYRVVGGMTNTLPPSNVFEGVLIRTHRIDRLHFTDNNRVCAETGVSLSALVRQATMREIGGFAELVGIPGTVGGAIFGNAGAHSRSIADTVVSVRAYDPETNKTLVFSKKDSRFSYRDSIFRQIPRYIILDAELSGSFCEREELASRMRKYTEIRRMRQPLSLPSLGSIFKHPTGDFAPRIIEELGLKGLTVGGATVSEKHAGFIVNSGSATPEDVKKLIQIIKDEVFFARGILLEEEINII